MSANQRVECLGDLDRLGMDVAVVCLGCGRTVVFATAGLAHYLLSRSEGLRLSDVARHMRCARRCGRGVRLQATSKENRERNVFRKAFPAPLYILPPGPAARAVEAARRVLDDALAEPGTHPVVGSRQASARAEYQGALRAWRAVIARKLDV